LFLVESAYQKPAAGGSRPLKNHPKIQNSGRPRSFARASEEWINFKLTDDSWAQSRQDDRGIDFADHMKRENVRDVPLLLPEQPDPVAEKAMSHPPSALL
jgi:hypothetical protein